MRNNSQKLKFKKHFVTGGAGFIGSHLVDKLIGNGNKVTVYDNFASGHKKNIEHHLSNKNFKLVKGNLLNFRRLKETMRNHDIVWHLGANTDIRKGNKMTDLDLKNCTLATWNVLEAMKQLKIKNIIFTSTSTVYGDVGNKNMVESMGPLLPICLYGAGKLACEGFISAYSYLFGIRGLIFRFGNVVGSRMDHGVILDFINKLKKNPKELLILGNGKQQKNFFLVEDCVNGMITVLKKSKAQCDVYNLGNSSFTTIKKVADIVVKEMRLNKVRYKYTGGKGGWKGDVPIVRYNIEKAKKLGWQPKYTSDEAVRIAARRLLDQKSKIKD